MDVRIETLAPIHVARIRHAGPYNEVERSWSTIGVVASESGAGRLRDGGAPQRRSDALGQADGDERGGRIQVVLAALVDDAQIARGKCLLVGQGAVDLVQFQRYRVVGVCGRGTHEKVYGELKGGFAFDCVSTHRYEANSAWQVFSVIAFNLMRALQAGAAERRSMNRKRRTIRPFQTIQTLRYRFINRAGLLVQPGGRQILDVGNNPMVRARLKAIEKALAA